MPRTPISRGDKALLGDDEWATSAFNELAPYTGAGFDDAAMAVLNAIRNGDEADGIRRPETAKTYIKRTLSPADLRSGAVATYGKDGRSQVVSYDVRDTVQAILPSLMRVLFAGLAGGGAGGGETCKGSCCAVDTTGRCG
jgi:hypothetical protein